MQCHVQVSGWLGVLAPDGYKDLDPLLADDAAGLLSLLNMIHGIDFSVDARGRLDPKQLLTSDRDSRFAGAPFAFLVALFKLFAPKFQRQQRGADSQPAASVCARTRMHVPMRGSSPRTHAHACASLRCALPFPHGATA
jgi:hypothetical protein